MNHKGEKKYLSKKNLVKNYHNLNNKEYDVEENIWEDFEINKNQKSDIENNTDNKVLKKSQKLNKQNYI